MGTVMVRPRPAPETIRAFDVDPSAKQPAGARHMAGSDELADARAADDRSANSYGRDFDDFEIAS